MADNSDMLVLRVYLDENYDFMVALPKTRTVRELREEIHTVAREVFPKFRADQVSSIHHKSGTILPDRYKIGMLLQNESRIVCYSSDYERLYKVDKGKLQSHNKGIKGGKDKDNKKLSQKDKPNKPLPKHSLQEAKGAVNHMHFSSSEVILSASKYKSLYTQPEHCHPKRKQAIETSASKVAEWLSTNDTSSINVQDTDNEEGTTDVHSESEEGPSKRVPYSRAHDVETDNDKKVVVEDNDDDDDDDDDDDGGGDSASSEDDSMVENVNNIKQATANKTTDCTQKNAGTMTDAGVFTSPSQCQRRASVESRLTNKSTLSSSLGNLLTCHVEIKKLPICIEHGRNVKVKKVHSSSTRTAEKYSGPKHIMNNGNIKGEHSSPKKRMHSTTTVRKHSCLKDRFSNGSARRAETQKTRDLQMSGGESPSDEQDFLEENVGSEGVYRRQSTKNVNEKSTTNIDNDDDYDGDDDYDEEEDYEGNDKVAPEVYENDSVTLDEGEKEDEDGEEDSEFSGRVVESVLSVDCRGKRDDLELNVHEQEAAVNRRTQLEKGDRFEEKKEISQKTEKIPKSDVDSTAETSECQIPDIDKKSVEEVSAEVKDMATDDVEEENNDTRPVYLTPIRDGEQIVWLKEKNQEENSEQVGEEYEDFMNGFEMPDCKTTSYESKRTGREKTPLLSSETAKESEEEKSGEDDKVRRSGRRNSAKTKRRSERKKRKPKGNEDALVENVNQTSLNEREVNLTETIEENEELEIVTQDLTETRSEQKEKKLERNKDTLVENVNQGKVNDKTTARRKTSEENVKLEHDSQSPSDKRSELKRKNLEGSEDTAVENVNQENVSDRTTASTKTVKENVELQFAGKRSEQEKRIMEADENSLVENVTQECVSDRTVVTRRSEVTPEKIAEKDGYNEDDDETLNERKTSDPVEITSNVSDQLQQESQVHKSKKNKKKKKEKRRKSRSSNMDRTLTMLPLSPSFEKVDLSDKAKQNRHVELESAAQDTDDNKNKNKRALKRKADEELNYDLLQNKEIKAAIGEETIRKKVGNNSYCEEERGGEDQRSNDKNKSGELGIVNDISAQLREGNTVYQVKIPKMSKKKDKKRKSDSSTAESALERVQQYDSPKKAKQNKHVELESVTQTSGDNEMKKKASTGEKTNKGQVGKDSLTEDEQSKDDERSNKRTTSNDLEIVNDISDQLQKESHVDQEKMLKRSKKKKKDKRRKSESSNMDNTNNTTSTSTIVERVTLKRKADEELNCDLPDIESPIGEKTSQKKASKTSNEDERSKDDEKSNDWKTSSELGIVSDISEMSEKKKEKSRNSELTNMENAAEALGKHPDEKGLGLTDPVRTKSKGDKTKSKASLALLDLALDDTADQGNLKTSQKAISREGRPAHQLARHFRQTPKGFLHSAKSRKITAATSSVIIRRKSRTNSKDIPNHAQITAKEKDLATSRVSFEQLLDDESLWDT